MRPVKSGLCVSFCFLFLIVLNGRISFEQEIGPLDLGVVIQTVQQHSEAERAGLQEGDVLLRWARADAHGELQSPFDLNTPEIEQAPRGNVLLEGLRGKEKKVWKLGPDRWGIQLRPNFRDDALNLYREGQDLVAAGKLSEAREKWRVIVGQQDISNAQWLRAWLRLHLAEFQAEARHWKESDEAFQEALQFSGADRNIMAQIHLAWGRSFIHRNDWNHAVEHFGQVMVTEQATGSNSLALAMVLDELGGLAQKQGDLSKAEGHYRQALHIRETLAPFSLCMVASLNNLGGIAERRSELDKAEDLGQQALATAEKIGPGSLTEADVLRNLGNVALDRGKLDKAGDYYRRSLDIYKALVPDSLDVASALNRLGSVAWTSGDLTKAVEYYHEALAIIKRLAPGSINMAVGLTNLGNVAHDQRDLAKAEEYYHQALAIIEKLAPGSLNMAAGLTNLGNVADDRGDLAKAEEYHHQALAIRERLAPGSLDVAASFTNLGQLVWKRGDIAKAEEYCHQALAITEKLAPGSMRVAAILVNLANVASARGDLINADGYDREALAIREKLAPDSLTVAMSLNNLGFTAWQRGDLAKAEEYYERALVIKEKLAPGSLSVAASLNNLGLLAHQRGDLAKAEEYYRQALFIREKLAPVSVDMAWNLNGLAELAATRGDFDEANRCYREALAIWEKLAPGSGNQADGLAGLASIQQQRGNLDAAAQFYVQALDALERQTARLGGSDDVRAEFRANYGKYYQDYISLLIQQGDVNEAFHVLERSRARTLLELLASSHLDIRRGADASLLQREHNLREKLAAKADRRIRLLTYKPDDQQVRAIEKEISDLNNEYQDVERQLRSNSPAYAALTQPRPLSSEAVQHLLPDNAVLLEYSLGESRSYVFAITAESLHSYELPKRGVVEPLARRLYKALSERSRVVDRETIEQRQVRFAKADAAAERVAAGLSQMVLGPVAADLKTRRLLIVGDGALQYVPFAALPVPGSSAMQRRELLMVEHEIAYLPSASVLAQLRQEQRQHEVSRARKEVAIFADPVFDKSDSRVVLNLPRPVDGKGASQQRAPTAEESPSDSPVRFTDTLARSVADANLGQRGEFSLPRLAFTRAEAKAILGVAPRESSMEALDFNANRTLAVGGELNQYRIVHFATHALVDNIHPELSGLVLSLVDSGGKPVDGFLELEDIYNLDLSADLVVLSACETALGKELKGEGMIGLTRGFMFAGAPRVMATLWNVNDFATAKLMTYFYQALERDRMKPAEALRQAQLAMWKQHSAPYYWAGFVLQGDWE